MNRAPLQGLRTVVRFNWHFFAMAGAAALAAVALALHLPAPWSWLAAMAGIGAVLGTLLSLAATGYAYDLTGLYRVAWLAPWLDGAEKAANIHAGFDETTALLEEQYPSIAWRVFDFYDPRVHTEISIRRARAVTTPHPATVAISTTAIPVEAGTLDAVLCFLSAHEIRDRGERVGFFREIRRTLRPGGRVIVVEHLRDAANVAVYGPGAWHFHPRSEWLASLEDAGLRVMEETKPNALITAFLLT